MNILYETSDWLVVEKPFGISTHGAWEGDLGVVEWLDLHMQRDLFVISRLDQETSGALILAKTKAASARAEAIHHRDTTSKRYLLIVSGSTAPPKQWTRQDAIDGKSARTLFKRLKTLASGLYLVEATLSAGRRHQIRRHAEVSGFPILGDTTYGGKPFARLCLHCTELLWPAFEDPVLSSLPPSMQSLVDGMGIASASPLAVLDRRHSMLDRITNSYRLVHRGELAGDFAIDKFGDYYCAWVYNDAAAQLCGQTVDSLITPYNLQGGVTKSLYRDPHHKGALCTTHITLGNPPNRITVEEHGLEYIVSLREAEQTGFFLDQRDNRRLVARVSAGSRVANLFSYTGSFSVVAAQNNPEVVFSVDQSKSALRESIANLNRNRLGQADATTPSVSKFVQDDTRKWLSRQLRKSPTVPFQVVICDPPTFGKSGKAPAFRVEKEWQPLASQIQALLDQQGRALFCCNNRSLSTAFLQSRLDDCFESVVRHRPPLDFPEQVDDRHIRMFWCTQPKPTS